MEALIKKVLYTGVGLVANTTEKVQQKVNNFVDLDGDYKKEGKRIVNTFTKSAEARRENLEDKAKDVFDNIMSRFDLISKRDYDVLLKKINKLEKAQKATVKSATATATTKSTTKTIKVKASSKK